MFYINATNHLCPQSFLKVKHKKLLDNKRQSHPRQATQADAKLFAEKWLSQIHRRLQPTNQRTPESRLDLLSGMDRIVDNVEQEMLHKWGICLTKQQ